MRQSLLIHPEVSNLVFQHKSPPSQKKGTQHYPDGIRSYGSTRSKTPTLSKDGSLSGAFPWSQADLDLRSGSSNLHNAKQSLRAPFLIVKTE